jgi:hypothetical protein
MLRRVCRNRSQHPLFRRNSNEVKEGAPLRRDSERNVNPAGLPDLSSHNLPKCGKYSPNEHKIYQVAQKYIHQMVQKYAKKFHSKAALKTIANLRFSVCKYTNWQPCNSTKKWEFSLKNEALLSLLTPLSCLANFFTHISFSGLFSHNYFCVYSSCWYYLSILFTMIFYKFTS